MAAYQYFTPTPKNIFLKNTPFYFIIFFYNMNEKIRRMWICYMMLTVSLHSDWPGKNISGWKT